MTCLHPEDFLGLGTPFCISSLGLKLSCKTMVKNWDYSEIWSVLTQNVQVCCVVLALPV